jgi:hypothetical protein
MRQMPTQHQKQNIDGETLIQGVCSYEDLRYGKFHSCPANKIAIAEVIAESLISLADSLKEKALSEESKVYEVNQSADEKDTSVFSLETTFLENSTDKLFGMDLDKRIGFKVKFGEEGVIEKQINLCQSFQSDPEHYIPDGRLTDDILASVGRFEDCNKGPFSLFTTKRSEFHGFCVNYDAQGLTECGLHIEKKGEEYIVDLLEMKVFYSNHECQDTKPTYIRKISEEDVVIMQKLAGELLSWANLNKDKLD